MAGEVKQKVISLDQLGTGLISDMNPLEVPPGACVAGSNLVFMDGYLRPRPGIGEVYQTLSTNSLQQISRYINNSGTVRLMRLEKNGSDLILYHYTSGAWTAATGASLAGLYASIAPTSCSWKGDWWFTTGGGELHKWNQTGNTVKVSTLSPAAAQAPPLYPRYIVAGNARLFLADTYDIAGSVRVPYRVHWSDTLDGTVWNGDELGGSSGYVDLADEDSDPVTGLYYSGSTLMVFKPNSIHIGIPAGPPKIYDFRQRTTGIGCVCHQSIKPYIDGWIYWLGDDNVYRGGVDRAAEPVADHILPRLREVVQLTNIQNTRALIDRENHFYHLFFPVGGRNYKIFSLNLKNGSWWEGAFANANMNVTAALEYRSSNWTRQMLLATDAGKVYEFSFSYLNDDGTSVSTSWTSGVVSVPKLTQGAAEQASLQTLRVQATAGDVQLGTYHGDNLDRMELTDFGTQTCDGSSQVMRHKRPPSAENFQIQLNHASAATGAKITKLGIGAVLLDGPTRR